MELIEQIVFSFFASIAFGIILNSPRRGIFYCGLAGSMGWVSFWGVNRLVGDLAIANFIGSVVIGLICIYLSRKLRLPVITLNTPAIVPLVPGGAAYMAVRSTVEENYVQGANYMMDVVWTAGAIVLGFMVVKLIENGIKASQMKRLG
ncbi:threonine/serine exporter family protein [Fundicoccus sp. Sow4_D5]|uniref:threonine/serine exporter family protein n=1 Tax=Fundicoccus sp. Sow4_D5 TaxID=3438782 RepID=UPI003F918F46